MGGGEVVEITVDGLDGVDGEGGEEFEDLEGEGVVFADQDGEDLEELGL